MLNVRNFPKGCRFIRTTGGGVSEMRKITRQCTIYDLTQYVPGTVVVQPRGKMKWLRFDTDGRGNARLIEKGNDPDVLIMKALLGG